MSTPSIKVGQGNWGIKAGNLLAYANTDKKYVAREFTVGRLSNTATRVNASGNIEIVNANIPRIDYFGGQASLLVEPAATNLALRSENFLTTWSPINLSVSGNVTGTTDPAGGNTANQIFETTTSGIHILAQTMSIVSGTTYAGSVFLKKAAGSPDWMQVAYSTTGLAGFANFNLTSGTVGNVEVGCTGRIQDYGNGWYRCTLIQTANASGTSGGPVIVFTNNTNPATRYVSYSGNTATSIYAWGAQLETGSVATSYIPTTTGSVTRNADVISLTGVAGLIGQTEGTIYAEVDARNFSSNARVIAISDGTGANAINLQLLSNAIRCTINASSSGQVDIIGAMPSGVNKIAVGYAQNNVSLFLNGSQVGSTDTSCNIPATNKVDLGSLNGGSFLNDRIRAVELYPTRLPNTTTDGSPSLQSITTL